MLFRSKDTDAGTLFDINLIPHTVDHTSLGDLRAGRPVNLEVDTVARYVERMMQSAPPTSSTLASSSDPS